MIVMEATGSRESRQRHADRKPLADDIRGLFAQPTRRHFESSARFNFFPWEGLVLTAVHLARGSRYVSL